VTQRNSDRCAGGQGFKGWGDSHHLKTDAVVPVAGIVDVAVGRTRVDPIVVPGPPRTTRPTSAPAASSGPIAFVVGIILPCRAGPLPHLPVRSPTPPGVSPCRIVATVIICRRLRADPDRIAKCWRRGLCDGTEDVVVDQNDLRSRVQVSRSATPAATCLIFGTATAPLS
jgi:hypothetical protein